MSTPQAARLADRLREISIGTANELTGGLVGHAVLAARIYRVGADGDNRVITGFQATMTRAANAGARVHAAACNAAVSALPGHDVVDFAEFYMRRLSRIHAARKEGAASGRRSGRLTAGGIVALAEAEAAKDAALATSGALANIREERIKFNGLEKFYNNATLIPVGKQDQATRERGMGRVFSVARKLAALGMLVTVAIGIPMGGAEAQSAIPQQLDHHAAQPQPQPHAAQPQPQPHAAQPQPQPPAAQPQPQPPAAQPQPPAAQPQPPAAQAGPPAVQPQPHAVQRQQGDNGGDRRQGGERRNSGGGAFVAGMVAGAVAGAMVAPNVDPAPVYNNGNGGYGRDGDGYGGGRRVRQGDGGYGDGGYGDGGYDRRVEGYRGYGQPGAGGQGGNGYVVRLDQHLIVAARAIAIVEFNSMDGARLFNEAVNAAKRCMEISQGTRECSINMPGIHIDLASGRGVVSANDVPIVEAFQGQVRVNQNGYRMAIEQARQVSEGRGVVPPDRDNGQGYRDNGRAQDFDADARPEEPDTEDQYRPR